MGQIHNPTLISEQVQFEPLWYAKYMHEHPVYT